MVVDWYFDFVSPFSYLQLRRLLAEPKQIELRFHPVLLAALLNHWGQLGPAEIPPKRVFLYRQLVWRARRERLPVRMPQGHPFNSLKLLRLALAADCDARAIEQIFGFVWSDGQLPDDEAAWASLLADPTFAEAGKRVGDPDIKEALRRNTELAIARGVFGVPTAVVNGQVFWGYDSTDMLFDYLRDPKMFDDPEMRRVSTLPVLAARIPARK